MDFKCEPHGLSYMDARGAVQTWVDWQEVRAITVHLNNGGSMMLPITMYYLPDKVRLAEDWWEQEMIQGGWLT